HPTLLAIFPSKSMCSHRLVPDWRHAGETAAGGRLPHCLRATNRSESICKNTQSAAAFLEASY
ncbi:MAG: hypothetical protein PUE84_05370, partial [Firmicutes bacterium]|nr:hypothetical protein [Bacillota bacterium]